MKKHSYFVGAALIGLALFFAGCSSPVTTPAVDGDGGSTETADPTKGLLSLTIDDGSGNAAHGSAARTSVPTFSAFKATVTKIGAGGAETVVYADYDIDASKTFSLDAGTYDIVVVASIGNKPSVSGTAPAVTIAAGQTASAKVVLDTAVEAGKSGYFDYSVISYPDTIFDLSVWDNVDELAAYNPDRNQAATATLTLTPIGALDGDSGSTNETAATQGAVQTINLLEEDTVYGTEGATTPTYRKIELPAGIYTMTLYLDSGNAIDSDKLDVLRTEAVYIYPYATTRLGGDDHSNDFLYQFTERDFQAGIWLQGTATVSDSYATDGYYIEQVNLYNSNGILIGEAGSGEDHADDPAKGASLLFNATSKSVQWEYFIEEVTKELTKTSYEGTESLWNKAIPTNTTLWVEIVAKSDSGKRLRSFKESFPINDKHGRLSVDASMNIAALDLTAYPYGDIDLATTLYAAPDEGAAGDGAYDPDHVPLSYVQDGTSTVDRGRIVRISGNSTDGTDANAGETYDVVSGTPYTLRATAGANWGLVIDRVYRNGYATGYYGLTGPSRSLSGGTTVANTAYVSYTDTMSSGNVVITADWYIFNAGSASLVASATTGYEITQVAIELKDTNDSWYNDDAYVNVSLTTTLTAGTGTTKNWAAYNVPTKYKYLTSNAKVNYVVKATKSSYADLFERNSYTIGALGSETPTTNLGSHPVQLYKVERGVHYNLARITFTGNADNSYRTTSVWTENNPSTPWTSGTQGEWYVSGTQVSASWTLGTEAAYFYNNATSLSYDYNNISLSDGTIYSYSYLSIQGDVKVGEESDFTMPKSLGSNPNTGLTGTIYAIGTVTGGRTFSVISNALTSGVWGEIGAKASAWYSGATVPTRTGYAAVNNISTNQVLWTSEQSDDTNAYTYNFSGGATTTVAKTTSYPVRAIKTFTINITP